MTDTVGLATAVSTSTVPSDQACLVSCCERPPGFSGVGASPYLCDPIADGIVSFNREPH